MSLPASGFRGRSERLLLWGFRTLAVALGAFYAWLGASRQMMNEDGISYLDVGDALWTDGLAAGINPVWSPLYPWLLGLAQRLVQPDPRWEFPLVHGVNFLVFLLALVSFEFFWRTLMDAAHDPARHRSQGSSTGEEARGRETTISLPRWGWISVGYALFIWASLALITVWAVTPDMLVAALVFLAAGLVVRIRAGTDGAGTFALLGVVLGVGYLAKAAMFPLALVFLGVAAGVVAVGGPGGAAGRIRTGLVRGAVGFAGFAAVASPLVVALSLEKGSATFGEAGTLTYAWHVNRVPQLHWQGDDRGFGEPVHPTRRILATPPVHEFAEPVGGTYPPWYNPWHWYEGVQPRLALGDQMRALIRTGEWYLDRLLRWQGGILAALALLYFGGSARPQAALRRLVGEWPLLIPPIAAFAMYALVYAEERYLAPFFLLLWGGLLAGVRLETEPRDRRLAVAGTLVLLFTVAVNLGAFKMDGLRTFLGVEDIGVFEGTEARNGVHLAQWELAEELRGLGLTAGDEVAVIGYSYGAYWARLARLRIVAEVSFRDLPAYRAADPAMQADVIRALEDLGVVAILSGVPPPAGAPEGWMRVGGSWLWIRLTQGLRSGSAGHPREAPAPAGAPTPGSASGSGPPGVGAWHTGG